ncbi:MAG: ABC transporter permease [Terriglobia bacterium]
MLGILRNIFRRKARAILTILGIIIGVFALISMGAMAEKLNLLVDGGTQYFKDKVVIAESNIFTTFSQNPISVDTVSEVEAFEDVEVAQAEVTLLLEELEGVTFGPPPSINGTDLRGRDFESFEVTFAEGRDLAGEDRRKVVVGSDLVGKFDAEVGESIEIKGGDFEVVGILEKTLTAPDTTVIMPLKDAQLLYHETLPQVVQERLEPADIATGITAFVREGADPDGVATTIGKQMDDVSVQGPQAFEDSIASSVGIFSSIITLIGVVALLIGGLSVVNTMSMSIAERTREIGIRKAIGASQWRIIRQFLAEAGMIGLIGGLLGLALGWLFTSVANAAGNASGTELFLVTPRLAVGSVAFALMLGIIGGFFPAWRAARLNPVEALRYE